MSTSSPDAKQMNHMPCMTAAAIELRAEILLESTHPGLIKRPKPVPIDQIAEQDFGLDIDYQYISADGSLQGLTYFNDGTATVYESLQKTRKKTLVTYRGYVLLERSLCCNGQEYRSRFALAHELGHWVLHADFLTMHPYSSLSQTEKNQLEWQADYFASCLLMPRTALCTLVKDWLARQRLTLAYLRSAHILEGQSNHSMLVDLIGTVSKSFEVPTQAAKSHLYQILLQNYCQH